MNAPDDMYEKEADQVADSVMRMPSSADAVTARLPGTISTIQRKCAACADEETLQREEEPEDELVQTKPIQPLQRKCEECEEEDVQRKGIQGAGSATPSTFEAGLSRAGRSGSSLPDHARGPMESRFGMDFSSVRIHTDTTSGRLADSIQAQAFTHGTDIYFGRGKFSPGTSDGKRLLAHELTHVVQQDRGLSLKRIQRDLAIEPTHPNAVGRVLTAAQMQRAIAFNVAQFPDPAELALIRNILGLPSDPAVIDEDFVNSIATYQAQYGETSDGRAGRITMARLAQEVRAEGASLTAAGSPRGTLDLAFALQEQLDGFIAAGNTTYADYRDAIRAATILNRMVALVDQAFMRRLRDTLTWNNFARSAELLGRYIPTGNELLRERTVRATLAAAWADSDAAVTIWDTHDPDPAVAADPCNPPVGGAPAVAAHEEGGWVYLNLITGNFITRRAAAGVQAGINVNAPPTVADSVIVATFHTHPNVGACWATAANPVFASPADIANANTRGVPNLIRGAFPAVANTIDISAGPGRRQHLAGSRLFPGAAGGLTPQATVRGKEGGLE